MQKKLFFLVFLITTFFISPYNNAYARVEDDIFTNSENNFGDISEYVFTMMYFQTGGTPCYIITSKRPPSCSADKTPKECLIEVIDNILLLAKNNIPSLGLNREYVISHLNNAYNYCLIYPDDIFAKALLATVGINIPSTAPPEDYYRQNNEHNSALGSLTIPQSVPVEKQRRNNRAGENNNENLSSSTKEQKVRILN